MDRDIAHIDNPARTGRMVRAHRYCRTSALAVATGGHQLLHRVVARTRRLWDERRDETGLDEAVTKMLWLAAGVAVAVAATTFFVGVFQDAQANVPDPIAPLP